MYLTSLSQRLQEFQSGLKTFQKKKEEMDHENIPNSRQFSNSYT